MSQPRLVLPMSTYHLTRRTNVRQMLLRPDRAMTETLLYLLAALAGRHGIAVHAFCAMSDHIHLVATDVRGELPSFLHGFHRAVALCTKAVRGWDDVVWDKSPTGVVRLETQSAVVEAVAYVLANPVSAGLVARAEEWPGAKTLAGDIGIGNLGGRRPDAYLNPKNPAWPAEATLPVSLPPGVAPEGGAAFRLQVEAELARLEVHAHEEMARLQRGFLGAERAVEVSPTERATKAEPTVDHVPRLAVGRGQGRARRAASAALRGFHSAYRAALTRWRIGARDTVFPRGTWWMRVFHHALVVDPADAATTGADAAPGGQPWMTNGESDRSRLAPAPAEHERGSVSSPRVGAAVTSTWAIDGAQCDAARLRPSTASVSVPMPGTDLPFPPGGGLHTLDPD